MPQEGQENDSLKENEHIAKFLTEHYFPSFNDNNPPGYAVMLSGGWGCGKTFLIQKVMADYATNHTGKQQEELFLYISLYGIKSTEEIDSAIFQKLHPVLSSNIGGVAASISSKLLFKGFKLDVSEEELKKLGKAFQEITPKEKNKIFILDDLERCSIDKQELLGYINNLVEHNGKRVILLSNEEKLFSREQKTREYKEKIIGKTFKVTPDFDRAFDSFIGSIKDKNARAILKRYRKTIQGVYAFINNNNLRSMKQAIINFPHFINQYKRNRMGANEKTFPKRSLYPVHTDGTLLDHTVQFYFYLSLGEKGGEIDKDNWISAINNFCAGIKSTEGTNTNEWYETKQSKSSDKQRKDSGIYDSILGEDWYDAVVNSKNVSEILEGEPAVSK